MRKDKQYKTIIITYSFYNSLNVVTIIAPLKFANCRRIHKKILSRARKRAFTLDSIFLWITI